MQNDHFQINIVIPYTGSIVDEYRFSILVSTVYHTVMIIHHYSKLLNRNEGF